MSSIDTIVVPIDFSETSLDALALACTLARVSHSHIHLLHVIPDPLRQPWITQAPGVDFVAMEKAWQEDAMKRLRAIAHQQHDCGTIRLSVRSGKASETILAYAADEHADLIVMGAHGESAVVRFFLGSVAERVVRHATIPVLTVPRGGTPAQLELATATANEPTHL